MRQNVLRVAPNEMRRVAVADDDTDVAAVKPGGDQPRQPPPVGIPPAMQRDKPRTVGADQQVVEVMLDAVGFLRNFAATGNVGQ